MKQIIFLSAIILMPFFTIARKQDSTTYNGCKLAGDTVQTVGDASILDRCPTFKNGYDDLFKFIAKNIHYPAKALKNKIEGKVFVSMVIEKDGSISHSKVERGVEDDLNIEAIRVIKSLPKWKPGILHKKPVRVKYWVPVSFELPTKHSLK